MNLGSDGLLVPRDAVALLADPAAQASTDVRSRLGEVAALFADDLARIEERLLAATRQGMAPSTDAAQHLLAAGGKRVRPLTVLLSAAVFGQAAGVAATVELGAVSELIHLATLLHDDVLDDGLERRGQPTSRRLWGNAVSVLAGDLLLTHALERTSRVGISDVMEDLFRTLRRLVDGEVVQLRGRTQLDPSEETYFYVARNKTASLFGWAARAGARAAGASASEAQTMGTFGEELGIAFQLVDDAIDYEGDTGKTKLGDLREDKLTLPLLRTLATRPELLRDVEAVRAGDDGEPVERLLVAVRAGTGCRDTRQLAKLHTERCLEALAAAPAGPARDLLASVARELTGRGR
ncbi:MAG: polyprenyl synthetase family protein [Myxococcales bacterium]|nr:polyprenyl synthetase family protein [Myxococcales bacterium]